MRRPARLPDVLTARPFGVAEAREMGVTPRRLRSKDLVSPFHAVRQDSEPRTILELCSAYLQRMAPGHVFCGPTAAVVLGIPLPGYLENDRTVHVAAPSPIRAPRAAGIAGHKLRLHPADIRTHGGLPITSPERTWLDLGTVLEVPDLVAAGDFLIHWRRPLTTSDRLACAVELHSGRRGGARLSESLGLLHPRSESRRESRARVVFVRAGIQGLEINLPVRLPGGSATYRLDFAIPSLKIAIEYQGDYHRDPEQWRRDMTRISRLRAHGWYVLEINADDLRDARELVARLRLVIEQRSRRA